MPKKSTRIVVRLPIVEKELIEAAAERRGIPMAKLVRDAVRNDLRRIAATDETPSEGEES